MRKRWKVRAVLVYDATGKRIDTQIGTPDFFRTKRGAQRFARQMEAIRCLLPMKFYIERTVDD